MKLRLNTSPPKTHASVIIIILALLGLMALLVVGNNKALARLHADLRLIEQKQMRNAALAVKTGKPPARNVNRPPSSKPPGP